MPALPFEPNPDRRHRIPRQKHKVTNWPAYEAGLRQRGSLTVWFTEEAVEAWAAEPRTTRGGQPWYSPLAILTALTLRAVFRLAFRQTEGLIGSVVGLLGLALRVPDHTTLSRRAATLEVPRPLRSGGSDAGGEAEPMHLLVDSTGLKLCGAGEWLVERHGTRKRRWWRKLHLGVDADGGQILASTLTGHDADDGAQVDPLLDQVERPVASLTGDGAYDQAGVYASVAVRHPEAAVIVPPRATAVPSVRHGRDSTHPARPPPPAYRRAWAHGLAESVRVHEAGPSRSHDGQVEAGDRRRAARACGRAPCDRGGRGCSCAQPHAGAGTPELCPPRLSPDGGGATASTRLIGAPRWGPGQPTKKT